MSAQAFDAHMLVRAHDPVTSVVAAEQAAALKRGPATAHELERMTGLTVVQLDRRLPDLERAGRARVVQVAGEDLWRGGARVWEVVS